MAEPAVEDYAGGVRALVGARKTDGRSVFGRIGYHKTLVAIANKHACIIWALLVKGEDFDVQRLAATTA